MSLGPSGTESNGDSSRTSISSDGRYIAFESQASNLVSDDTNAAWDIFVYDSQTDLIERVSVSVSGVEGNADSHHPSISSDGRCVAFYSTADNLLGAGVDTNGVDDIFVHDRQTGATELMSVGSSGTQANGISRSPSISADGRYVAFASIATNLAASDANGAADIFVHDRQSPYATERVSVDGSGNEAHGDSTLPSISDDGRYVAFVSTASDLVTGDTNGTADIFVHDRQSPNSTTRVSVDGSGAQANGDSDVPYISPNGKVVVFSSAATNLIISDTNFADDIFLHDRQTGSTERVSVTSNAIQATGNSYTPSVNDDGRYIVFESDATDLVTGDDNAARDIFIHDRQNGTTIRLPINVSGNGGNGDSSYAAISRDGYYTAFSSVSTNLVPNDTNDQADVFFAPNP